MQQNHRCYCDCHARVVDPEASEEEARVLRTLGFMLWPVTSFLDCYFAADSRALKTRVGKFFGQGGFQKTFRLFSYHSSSNLEGRVKSFTTAALKNYIGEDVVNTLSRIISQELKDIQKSGVLRHPVNGITPAHAEKEHIEYTNLVVRGVLSKNLLARASKLKFSACAGIMPFAGCLSTPDF